MTRPGRGRGRAARVVALLLAAIVVAGCSGTAKPKPTPLEPVTPQIGGRLVWTQRVESVKFPLQVAVNETASSGGVFTVAATDGTVVAIQAESGSELWRASVGTPLSAGVGGFFCFVFCFVFLFCVFVLCFCFVFFCGFLGCVCCVLCVICLQKEREREKKSFCN